MSSLAPTAPDAEQSPGRTRLRLHGLHGLNWLVWRQHRAYFRVSIAFALALTGYLVYLHASYETYLATQAKGPDPSILAPDAGFSVAAFLLYIAPLVTGAVFGAQLFAREYADGTYALVRAQSVSGTAWVRAKLLVPATMLLLCVTPCAAALTWDYSLDPYRQQIFLGRQVFESIGPAAVAIAMVGLLLGAAAGLTWPRSGAAPILAFLLVLAFKLILGLLPSLLSQDRYSIMWSLQLAATGVCVITCAGLIAYCRLLIRRRPC